MSNGISPQRTLLNPNGTHSSSKGKNKRPFDLTGLAREEERTVNDENADVVLNDLSNMIFDAEPLPVGNDSGLGDFDPGSFGEHIEESIEQGDDSQVEGETSAAIDPEPLDESALQPRSVQRSKYSKPAPVAQMVDPDDSQFAKPVTRRKPGRPRQPTPEVYEDPTPSPSRSPSILREKPRKKDPPRQRDPNARPPTKTVSKQKAPAIREGSAGPRGRSYQVQRSATPATDNGAIVTRSGRASFKPLASWRGEKVVYGRRPDWDTPAPVTDIIRTEEVHVAPPPRKQATRKPRAPSELEEIEEEEEEEKEEAANEDAQWETDVGIKYAQVMTWNQEAGKYDEDETETIGTSPHSSPEIQQDFPP